MTQCRLAVFFFIFTLIFSPVPAFSQAAGPISGKIQKITPLGGDLFELVIEEGGNESTFVMNRATLIQSASPAKELKKGQKIVTPPKEGGGVKGGTAKNKMPFENMAEFMKKKLGLPDLPKMPEVPKAPEIPKAPQVPKAPKMPQVKGKPAAPGTEAAPQPNPGEEMPEGAPPELNAAALGGKSKKQMPEPPKPGKDTLGKLIPEAISPATPYSPDEFTKKVVDVKKTDKGIEIQLEGEEGNRESLVIGPEDTVFRVLGVEELHTGMGVELQVSADSKEKLVQRIVVI